jgi:hypothetical protein
MAIEFRSQTRANPNLIPWLAGCLFLTNTALLIPAALRLFAGIEVVLEPLVRHFNLLEEANLFTSYSSLLLVLTSVAALANFLLEGKRSENQRSLPRYTWLGMGVLSLFLSLEEVVQLHETIQTVFHGWMKGRGEWAEWVGTYGRAWIILYAPGILVVMAVFCSTAPHLFRGCRGGLLLALGGMGLWGLALFLDFFYVDIARVWGIWYFNLEVLLEEGAEIFGTSSLLVAFVWYGHGRWNEIRPGLKFVKGVAASLFIINASLLIPFALSLIRGVDQIPGELQRQLDVRGEGNFFAWYSSLILLLTAVAALWNFWLMEKGSGDDVSAWRYAWLGIGAVALLLALDEKAQLHESAGRIFAGWLLERDGWMGWAGQRGRRWIIFLSPGIVAVLVGFFVTFLHMFRGHRVALAVALGSMCLWLVVLGLEFFTTDIHQEWGPRVHLFKNLWEEGLEIFANSGLLVAFAWYGAGKALVRPREALQT